MTLHVVLVSEDLAVARVANRVENDGHEVPEAKVRSRYGRPSIAVSPCGSRWTPRELRTLT